MSFDVLQRERHRSGDFDLTVALYILNKTFMSIENKFLKISGKNPFDFNIWSCRRGNVSMWNETVYELNNVCRIIYKFLNDKNLKTNFWKIQNEVLDLLAIELCHVLCKTIRASKLFWSIIHYSTTGIVANSMIVTCVDVSVPFRTGFPSPATGTRRVFDGPWLGGSFGRWSRASAEARRRSRKRQDETEHPGRLMAPRSVLFANWRCVSWREGGGRTRLTRNHSRVLVKLVRRSSGRLKTRIKVSAER